MAKLESETRDCYDNDEPSKSYTSEKFVEMMLFDACFILELFTSEPGDHSADDPIFTYRGISPNIQRDLLMLENQLPLSVLNSNFISVKPRAKHQSVAEMAIRFFKKSAIPGLSEPCSNLDKLPHILDVVRQSMLPEKDTDEEEKGLQTQKEVHLPEKVSSTETEANEEEKNQYEVVLHSVTELRSTGIKFRRKDSKRLLNIEFKKGILDVPPLVIHDSTKSIFLNHMAFEQLYYPHCSSHFTAYVSFMDGLIDSPKDVEYLHRKGIIEHSFGSGEDVADLFNNLRKEIDFHTNDYHLAKVSHALHKHSERRVVNGWKAILRHEYLKDPWKIISLAAASFLILLTVAQVAYAVLTYHFPSL